MSKPVRALPNGPLLTLSPGHPPPKLESGPAPGLAFSLAVLTTLLTLVPVAGQEAGIQTLTPTRTFSSEGFSRIRGVQELSDGRILVADQVEAARIALTSPGRIGPCSGAGGKAPGNIGHRSGSIPFGVTAFSWWMSRTAVSPSSVPTEQWGEPSPFSEREFPFRKALIAEGSVIGIRYPPSGEKRGRTLQPIRRPSFAMIPKRPRWIPWPF